MLGEWQQRQLDPFHDGSLSGGRPPLRDVKYLVPVLARKYRFVESWNFTSTPGAVNIQVRLYNEVGEQAVQQTRVRFIIATTANVDRIVFVDGDKVTLTSEGYDVVGVHVGNGVYRVSVVGDLVSELDVGVGMVIRTFEVEGVTSRQRVVPFYSTSSVDGFDEFDEFRSFDIVGSTATVTTKATSSVTVSATLTPSQTSMR